MPLICPTSITEPVPQADAANNERAALPEDFVLANTEFTIPIATNSLDSITFFFEATGTGAGLQAEIYVRPRYNEAWKLLVVNDIVSTPTEQLTCPVGQLRVLNNGLTTLKVWVQGILINQ